MVSDCPQCAAPVDAAAARFCGRCGAYLPARSLDEEPAAPESPSRARRIRVALGAAVALAVVVAAVSRAGLSQQAGPSELAGPSDEVDADREAVQVPVGSLELVRPTGAPTAGAGRAFAARGSVVWERELPPAATDASVEPAGAAHVLVGGRVVPTAQDAGARVLLGLPAPLRDAAFDADGRWAVGEAGRLVVGSVGEGTTAALEVDWQPDGVAFGWVDGDVLLRDRTGRLVRAVPDGTRRWTTTAVVQPVGPVAGDWQAAVVDDGRTVAVDLTDGSLVDLPGRVLTIDEDIAVVARDDAVVGHDLDTGRELWRRPADGATWRSTRGRLVAAGAGQAERVDPQTGETTDRVSGFVPTATGDVVVVQQQGTLRGLDWDGRVVWERDLDVRSTHVTAVVDDERLAVRSRSDEGVRVSVLRFADGQGLTTVTAPTVRRDLVVGDGVAVLDVEGQVLLAVTRAGEDAPGPVAAAADRPGLSFGTGSAAVEVGAGTTTLEGTGGQAWTRVLEAPLAVAPARAGTSVVIALVDGTVMAVRPGDGAVRWQRDLEVLPTALASDGTMLLVGTADGRVLRLDPAGEPVTTVVVGQGAVAAVAPGRPAVALLGDRLVGLSVVG